MSLANDPSSLYTATGVAYPTISSVKMSTSALNLAVTFATASPFLSNPSSIASAHPALHRLHYANPAGQLSDVLVFTVPAASDGTQRDEVVDTLRGLESVLRVDVLEPRTRRKRDEF